MDDVAFSLQFIPNEVKSDVEKKAQLDILKRLRAKKPALNVEQAITYQSSNAKYVRKSEFRPPAFTSWFFENHIMLPKSSYFLNR